MYTRKGHDWTRQVQGQVQVQGHPSAASGADPGLGADRRLDAAIDGQGRTNFSMLKAGIAAGMPLAFHALDLSN